jgi:hypothetical protein
MAVVALLIFVLCLTELLSWSFAAIGLVAAGGMAVICSYAIHQGDRAVRYRVREQQARNDRQREARDKELFLAQEEHAAHYRA